MWTVGFLAVIQIVATGWAVLRRGPVESAPAIAAQTTPMQPAPVPVPVEPAPAPPTVSANRDQEVIPYPVEPERANPLLPDPGANVPDYPLSQNTAPVTPQQDPNILPQPTFIGPATEGQSLSEALANASLTVDPIAEPMLERLVATAEEHRASSNMESALRDLREAETAIPDHPRVLGGLAATLSQMGLDNKAKAYWEKLYDLGPIRGGSYYKLAESKIKGEAVPEDDSTGQIMKVAKIDVAEKAPTSEGQKVSLTVKIEADPSLRPTGEDTALLVYFYDKVNGDSIDASTADTSYIYPTEPYDWATDGTETIIVNYHQPIFTEEQQRELGERVYYGYAVELYYRDVLQDKITVPEDIAALRETLDTGPELDTPSGPGPENALFPDPLNP